LGKHLQQPQQEGIAAPVVIASLIAHTGEDNMPKPPAYIRNLKAFARGPITAADLPRLEAELFGINDRAAALMLGAIVENALTTLLISLIRPNLNADDRRSLFDSDGALGTFSSKTVLAYALGGIGRITRHDVDLIRLIRNEFAHSRRSFDFRQKEVAEVCAHLKTPDLPNASAPIELIDSLHKEDLGSSKFLTIPKVRLVMACHTISIAILQNLQPKPAESFESEALP
jgi:DNA-binding MltR family transcriptional regulator